jgi:tyrosine-protein phosphatase YwqE
MHSHLLPGIDDGAQDLSASLEMIRGFIELGYKKLITTPHIMWDLYRNTTEIIMEKFEAMQEILEEEKIDIELQAAAEYFIDDHFLQMLHSKEALLTFGDKYVLVEFSMASQPLEWKEALFEMQMRGYQPVIAHPERYSYLQHNKDIYEELKAAGYFFQLNLLSLTGAYGKTVHDLAHHLTKKKYYDFVGSDMHHNRHLKAMQNPAIDRLLEKVFESGNIRNSSL